MAPKSPQRKVKIVVGKKKKSPRILLWVCLLTIGGVLAWVTKYSPPFTILNGSQRAKQTDQAQPARETKIGTTSAAKAPPAARLGVARATIQSLFEQPDIGFTFENSSPVNGAPRLIGTSAHGLATLELIGPPEDLSRATIRVSIPDDDTHALTLNAEYVLRFIKTVAPQWTEGGDWVIQNLEAFAAGQQSAVKTIQAGKEISMTLTGEQELLTITVKAAQ